MRPQRDRKISSRLVSCADSSSGLPSIRAVRPFRSKLSRLYLSCVVPRAGATPGQGAYAGLELGQRKRLSHVVVGAKVQPFDALLDGIGLRSEEHTSELQSLMRISYAVFCLKKNNNTMQ